MAEQKKHWWDGMKPEDMTPEERVARYYGNEERPKPVTAEQIEEMRQFLLADRARREREKRGEK